MKYRYIVLISLLAFIYSCKPELDDFQTSAGSADFTTYVALGNSLTAGYADGSVYRSAQLNSFPSIIAKQFQKVGGGEFVQPLMEGEYGILPGKRTLGYSTDCLDVTSLAPIMDEGPLDPIAPIGYTVNNMGVPGAKSFHLMAPGYGDFSGIGVYANPYFARFATSATTTVIEDAMAMQPTFFSLWIGNNDVLGYATSGGLGDTITGQATFGFVMNGMLATLTSGGAKGAIANVPDVTSIPFFTTVPANGYALNQEQADILNENLGPLGFSYQEGPNYFIIADANAPLGFRQMVDGELVLLTVPQDSIKCAYWGGFNPYAQLPVPIPGQYILTLDEIANIETATAGFNQTIQALASQYDLALVDMNAEFNNVKNGIVTDGVTLSTDFITGNAFSLDGVHGTQMGYAHVANTFIHAINTKYGSSLPTVSLTSYPANELP